MLQEKAFPYAAFPSPDLEVVRGIQIDQPRRDSTGTARQSSSRDHLDSFSTRLLGRPALQFNAYRRTLLSEVISANAAPSPDARIERATLLVRECKNLRIPPLPEAAVGKTRRVRPASRIVKPPYHIVFV